MNFEVEKRGLFTKSKYNRLLKFMKTNATFIKQKKRFQLVYLKKMNFKADPTNPVDLRVRITNGEGKLVLKYGNWHTGESRAEYEVDFPIEEIEEVLNIFKILDKKWGTSVFSDTQLFRFKGIEVAIVHTHKDIYYWELELLVKKKSEIKKAESRIEKLITEFSLKPLSSKGMQKYVNDLNKRRFWQFNFKKEDIGKWLKKHKEYLDLASKKSRNS